MEFVLIIHGSITHGPQKGSLYSNAILFDTYKEALEYARHDAELYKHLCSVYTEHLGENNLHATITLSGKDINKCYRISNLGISTDKTDIKHPNTYCSADYYDGYMLF